MTAHVTGVNVSSLRELYRVPVWRLVLDYFAERTNNSASTTIDGLLAALRKAGRDVPRRSLIELFKRLEAAQCGTFVFGRKGYRSRFEWSVSLIVVGQAASGETDQVEPAAGGQELHGTDDEDAAGVDVIQHRYRLRPDFEVVLVLPVNLSGNEAARLSDFLKTLPFG
jgi:hypothetical protein